MKRFPLPLLTALLLAGCQTATPEVTPNATQTVVSIPATLNNDDTSLNARIEVPNASVSLLRDSGTVRTQGLTDSFQLVGVSSPMRVGTTSLRATHVSVSGDYAFVAYAKEGATYAGGFEVVNTSNPSKPKVTSSVSFDVLDVNAVYADANSKEVYFAGAVDVDKLSSLLPAGTIPDGTRPAFVGKASFSEGKIGLPIVIRLMQKGFAGNGILKTADGIYVSSGDDQALSRDTDSNAGGLGLLNGNDLSVKSWQAFPRAQFVASDGKTVAALESGTAGKLRLFQPNLSGSAVVNIGAVGPVEGKNTLTLDGQFVYVAKGTGGLEVYNLANALSNPSAAKPVSSFQNRVPANAGNPGEYLLNAVTVESGLLYMAGGAAGVYVARVGTAGQLSYEGIFDLQDASGGRGSANFVASDAAKKLLFVASGDGGLKIIRRQ